MELFITILQLICGLIVIGIVLFVLVSRFDYRALSGFTTFFVVINVILLLSPHLPFIGREVNGAAFIVLTLVLNML